MASILKKVVQLFAGDDVDISKIKMPHLGGRPLETLTERDLLKLESEIGSTLFGPVPEGHSREFFCLDESTWIWHEQWLDHRKLKTSTVRYEVQPQGVLKIQEGARYSYLDGEELRNFVIAVRVYYEQVTRRVYHRNPESGQKLA